ncbi:MAG TPA: SRPBCC domain-containing protein [Thermomicrobiales bacterium]|jgi:uncharacterized protein YndB with AHSA1/START domain|nr:SRPBCC domain-containing protein [Thermomicrobiales bacterium]
MSDLAVTNTDTRLTMTRTFGAPRQFVWDAYTVPEQIVKWWGPVGFTTTVKAMDVRPGGVWHYRMHSPEWGDSWGLATYSEVSPIDRLVYTDAFTDESGAVNADMPVANISIEFADQGDRTLVTIHTDYATAEELQKVLEMGVTEGAESQYTRLDELAASEGQSA